MGHGASLRVAQVREKISSQQQIMKQIKAPWGLGSLGSLGSLGVSSAEPEFFNPILMELVSCRQLCVKCINMP